MIAIINYGVGNLFSLSSSLKYLGLEGKVTNSAVDLKNADRIILPGVGAFGDAMVKLDSTGLIPVLNDEVAKGKPLLGICLGMQILLKKSYEYGEHKGLGYIKGEVCSLSEDLASITGAEDLKVPHIGWNCLNIVKKDQPLLKYTDEGSHVYFVHSFYGKNCDDALVATAEYGVAVPAIVSNGNVFGCQFHPEKSGEVGLKMLKAFSEIK